MVHVLLPCLMTGGYVKVLMSIQIHKIEKNSMNCLLFAYVSSSIDQHCFSIKSDGVFPALAEGKTIEAPIVDWQCNNAGLSSSFPQISVFNPL